jgi:hypothetical protein
MSKPPQPKPTNPEQHAPGVSRTLEKSAAAHRDARGRAGGADDDDGRHEKGTEPSKSGSAASDSLSDADTLRP